MNTLVPSRRAWLAPSPVVGAPAQWARRTAAFGGLMGVGAPSGLIAALLASTGTAEVLAYPVMMLTVVALPLVVCALTAMVLGAAAGALQPAFVERVRGRVPLPLLVVAQSGVGAAVGAASSVAGFLQSIWLMPYQGFDPVSVMCAKMGLAGAVIGGLATLAWWLPFTVATVTGGRPGRVSVAVATGASLLPLLFLILRSL